MYRRSCFDTHDDSDAYWHNYFLPNSTRTYQWLLCVPFFLVRQVEVTLGTDIWLDATN